MIEYLQTIDLITKFTLAIFLSGLIGLERQYKGKTAGVRTSNLICLGTVLFIYLGQTIQLGLGDPTRTLSAIVNGIGWLGAGGIIATNGAVVGLTSASVVWMLAAIGCAIGFGLYKVAIFSTIGTLFILIGVNILEKLFKKLVE